MAMKRPSFELMCWVNSVEKRRQATARFRVNRTNAKTGDFLKKLMRLFYLVNVAAAPVRSGRSRDTVHNFSQLSW